MRRKSLWIFLGFAALAPAAAYQLWPEKASVVEKTAQAATPAAEKTVAVEARTVTVDTVIEGIQAVGTLRANEAVTVSPEIAGRINRIHFEEGDDVAAGDVLVEFDSAILRAELAKAQSDLTLANANKQRAITLAQQGTGTLRTRDEAVAAHQAAEANVALAQARLNKASITAPLSGIVGLRSVSPGAYLTPGDRIVELADIDPIKVDFRVPELVLSNLRTNQTIRVTVDAVPGRSFDGEIYAIDPVVDPNGRAVRLRARIPNPDRVLFPGLFARVQIVVDRRENRVLVPESAIFARGENRFVFRVVDGRAVLTPVELGQRRPGEVEVTDGLTLQDVVVTAGHQQVRDGVRVDILEPRAGS